MNMKIYHRKINFSEIYLERSIVSYMISSLFLMYNSKLNIVNMSFPKISWSYPRTEELKIKPRRIIRISCRMLTLNRALQQSLFSFSPLYYSECIQKENSQRVQKGRLISLGFLPPQIERSNCEKIRDLLQPF